MSTLRVDNLQGQTAGTNRYVVQVVNATSETSAATTSTSFVTTGLTASITPSNANNKILISFSTAVYKSAGNAHGITTIFRGTVSGTDFR